MFCKKCGSEIDDGASFCTYCGAPTVKPEAEAENTYANVNPFEGPAQDCGREDGYFPPFTQPQSNNFCGEYDSSADFRMKYNFGDSVKRFFRNYSNFRGRAVKTEYWYIVLFNILVSVGLGIVAAILGVESATLSGIWTLATIVPSIALTFRRLHDTGRSGIYVLVELIPIVGWIIMIIYLCSDSVGDNEYGPAPRNY